MTKAMDLANKLANLFAKSVGLSAAERGFSAANLGFINPDDDLVINGCFDIAQRGNSQTIAGYGSVDRWSIGASGGAIAADRFAFGAGDTLGSFSRPWYSRLAQTGQTAISHYAARIHRIEDVRSYQGQTITVLGFARRVSGQGKLMLEATQFFGGADEVNGSNGGPAPAQVMADGTGITEWQPFAITIAVPSIAGKVITSADNCFSLVFWQSAGADFAARAGVGLQTCGFDITGIHIRKGVVPVQAINYYSPRRVVDEEIACMRYFEKIEYRGSNHLLGAGSIAPIEFAEFIPFKVRKRHSNPACVHIATSPNTVRTVNGGFAYTGLNINAREDGMTLWVGFNGVCGFLESTLTAAAEL